VALLGAGWATARPSIRFERCANASSILCWECSRISSITSDPVEKKSTSASFTSTGCVSVGWADAEVVSSIVWVVVAALTGLELSSKPSIQTTEDQSGPLG
jgi:hypothetical protein